MIQKVYAYILDAFAEGDCLLVFEHVDFLEAGIQVPSGSVESGKRPKDAVLREAKEETAISNLKLVGELGVVRKDMGEFGLNCVHERHFFQFDCLIETPTEWIAFEHTPSDGSRSPIAFRFYWKNIKNPSMLSGELGEFLNRLLCFRIIFFFSKIDWILTYPVMNLLKKCAAKPAKGGKMKVIP